ncbi:MAG TPA: tRNA (N6-isopentenyl adenosine(37)-C2)-methylthiotransferase MiaB [Firmicutes bacterium]|nr:tRNA (N6-isopentenyl adenosine(37)-C2)-methylthiotransferase MiaB [Bacillota bacterium]HAZ21537.1 tRNA (N6-isopentenyl adenosine(37)-C2)-methylthiotransferase MiaB [Bacillota bacterium]HBE06574.1 tRNA (N6-isopentenyl adenosine(37)-C2)-methylthiotransferase MiaB [Bacillota bacterium]HBG44712.1 tRNA (N6-isopentenyl adenosine(37)-C2)-methylthiotransferase MiaB [Bacillota bacterium]HBL51337.1 tRNA (N6-isopentenyl adenosine(37)-C2)-methylthiotransferase MiaB [Bacillota bacterium]
METKTYRIVTFGCQMNEHDSEILAGILEKMGYQRTESDEADVTLFNTCCVRENAAQRLYGHVASLKRIKKTKPDAIIGVCGCLPQQPGEAAALMRQLAHVDLVFGTHNTHRLPELIARFKETGKPICEILAEGDVVEDIPVKRASQLKAWVTIMHGCNNFCSYCIVPYVRGREKSRQMSDILAELSMLGNAGVREVTLLGQNVNSYGKDLDGQPDFADLLRAANGVPGIERIRFQTSHPRDVTTKLIQTMADCEKVCEHLHLPLQAGSDRVLRLMNRGYTAAHYLNIVDGLRHAMPEISLTTDIIVGFPGESAADFEDTLAVMKAVRYDSAFTFAYSPRKGTPAAASNEQVDAAIKQERLQQLINLQNGISLELNQAETGRVHEILVEGPSQREETVWVGRTRSNKLVHFNYEVGMAVGQTIKVLITEGQTHTLYGTRQS